MNKYNIDFDLKYLRYLIITHFSSITYSSLVGIVPIFIGNKISI